MTAKEYKYYALLDKFFSVDAMSDPEAFGGALKAVAAVDFAAAARLWEYELTKNDGKLDLPAYADVYADVAAAALVDAARPKFARLLLDSDTVRSAVYRRSRRSLSDPVMTDIVVSMLTSGKTEDADELLKCAQRNTAAGGATFGAFLLAVVDRTIVGLIKKSSKNPMSKKLSAFLLAQADKVSGDEKALIIQRIKELG